MRINDWHFGVFITVGDNNTGEQRDSVVTFKSVDGSQSATLSIKQTARTAEEVPELKITSNSAAFDGKDFNWNAAQATETADKSVTFNVSSSFSGDDWTFEKETGFDDYFTLTDQSTKGAILDKNYSVTVKTVNNDWSEDIVKTITFTPKSATGDPVEDNAVELTFKITKRGGDGAAPTVDIKAGESATTGTTFDYKGNVKDVTPATKNYSFTVTPGTYSADSWTYEGDQSFGDYFTLTESPANSGNFTVSAKALDNSEHVGKLTFTPTAGEGHNGTPVVMTFTIEEYVQTLSFKHTNSDITESDTLNLGWQSTNNSYVITVIPDPNDNWDDIKASVDGDFNYQKNGAQAGTKTVTITPKGENKTGAAKEGTVTITSASGIPYTFNIKQAPYVQNLTFKRNAQPSSTIGTSFDSGYTFEFDSKASSFTYPAASNYSAQTSAPSTGNTYVNIYGITVTAPSGDNEDWTAEVDGDDFELLSSNSGRKTGSQGNYAYAQPSAVSGNKWTTNGTKTLYIRVKAQNKGSEKTGILKITSASGIEYNFTLSQAARGAQTLTATPASGTLYQFAKVTSEGSNMSKRYSASFSTLKIKVTSSDGEKDWTVDKENCSYAGGLTVNISDPDDDGYITVTPVFSNSTSDWSDKSGALTIKLKNYAEETTTLSYTLSIKKVTVNNTNKTVSIPQLTNQYTAKASITVDNGSWRNTSASFSNINTTTTSQTLDSARTLYVKGQRSSGSTGSCTVTVTVTNTSGFETSMNFTYSFSSNGSTFTLQ